MDTEPGVESIVYEANAGETETNYGDESETDYGDFEDVDLEITRNNTSLPPPRSAENPVPEDTASMVEFDMMRSSPPADPAATMDQEFLSSAANWERGSTRDISARMPEVDRIRRVINNRFGLKARPWQVSALVDITMKKRDVCAIANTNAGKSLVYQAIPVVTGGSVLVISPTIALMEDQCDSIRRTGLSVIALTSRAVAEDPGIWRRMDRGMYNVILASPEALLGARSWFWQNTVRNKNNEFQRRLSCIAIDEAHVIWGWRDFREEYRMLGHLKDVFPTTPMVLLSATVTPNILEYVRVSLKLSPPSRIYRQPLDRPNLTYIVSPIRKGGFKDLDFLIPSGGAIGEIPKTMIFVDKIDTAIQMAKYLRSRLSKRIRNEGDPEHIIRTFSANLTTISRYKFLASLRSGDTRIWICTECAGMGINLPDIRRAIQFGISDYITLPELLQRLGRGGRDASRLAVAIVFVETRQILPDDVHTLEGSAFKDLRLPVSCENRDQTTDVIVRLYREHIQSKAAKTGNSYQRTNPAVLWFLNTTGCRRRMVLAYFMCKMAFDDRMDREYCCDNCMYNHAEAGQVPDFEVYDVIAKLGMMYARTTEYSDLLLFSERQRLLAANPTRGPRTTADQTRACEEALNNFALQTWPDNGLASLNFPIAWRQRLAKVAIRITSVELMRKELLPGCILRFSSLDAYANTIVDIIGLSVQVEAIPRPANPPAETSADPPAERPEERPGSRPAETPREPIPSPDPPVAPPAASLIKPPADRPVEIPLERPAESPRQLALSPLVTPQRDRVPLQPPADRPAEIPPERPAESPRQPALSPLVTPQRDRIPLQPRSSNILPRPHRTYKIRNQYEYAIDFSSPTANPITFNSSFGNSSGNNSNPELSCAPEPSCAPDDKETKAKAKKDAREKKKAEAKEEKKVATEAAREKKRVETEAAKEKKRVAAEVAKEKKRVEAEVAKEKKRVEAEVLAQKKLDDKAAKNVETALEKAQISKRKAALSASNPLPKKKQRRTENNKPPVIEPESEPESMSEANSSSRD